MIPFVGPSYSLATYKASSQRTVNMVLSGMETPSKAPFILEALPGLTVFCDLGAEIRGTIRAGRRAFAVAGSALYEISAAGVATQRGTLQTSTGTVGMQWGTTQLVIVDGHNGYVLTLGNNDFGRITDPDFYGSETVGYADGFFIFVRPDTQQFYISAIDDASNLDALDFASAESSPDDLVGVLVDHRQVLLFGTQTVEPWFNSGGLFPFQRNAGASVEIGLQAAHSLKQIDNGVMFLGQDRNGSGMVYRMMDTSQAVRVSTIAVEEALAKSTDLSAAVATVWQESGKTYYLLTAPGLTTTWGYEVSTGTWFEAADLDEDGQFKQWRIKHMVYAHDLHLGGGDDGILYKLDKSVNTYAGDPRACERSSPHSSAPTLERLSFGAFILDATTGEAAQEISPQVELSWSNDGGATFGDPVLRSLGRVGERFPRITWRRLGMARNRVWRLRFSGDAPFSIISAEVT